MFKNMRLVLLFQALKFASALDNCRGFCRGILEISPICLSNKIAEANFLSNIIFFSYHNYCQIIMNRRYHANLFQICFFVVVIVALPSQNVCPFYTGKNPM